MDLKLNSLLLEFCTYVYVCHNTFMHVAEHEWMDDFSHKMNHMRIVTFNVHYCKNPNLVAEAFKKNANLRDADVILLQEVEEHVREEISRVKKIAQALQMEHAYAPARNIAAMGTHGLAIVSR